MARRAWLKLKGFMSVMRGRCQILRAENQGAGPDENSYQTRCPCSLSQMNGAPMPDIQVFGYLLHTHLAGRALQAVQYR